MNDIEKRARELLATQYDKDSRAFTARQIRADPAALGEDFVRSLRAIIAALTPPEGWVLVPVEPTRQMQVAALEGEWNRATPAEVWAAMLAARPEVIP